MYTGTEQKLMADSVYANIQGNKPDTRPSSTAVTIGLPPARGYFHLRYVLESSSRNWVRRYLSRALGARKHSLGVPDKNAFPYP